MAARKKEGTPNTFTFYDGFSASIELLPDFYSKACFCYDIQQYGAWGVEPTFKWVKDDATRMAVEMAWMIALPSIQKSVQNHKNSTKPPAPGKKKRGRPRKDETATKETNKAWEETDCSNYQMTSAILDDADAFASEIPDEIIDALAETAMMEEAEVW